MRYPFVFRVDTTSISLFTFGFAIFSYIWWAKYSRICNLHPVVIHQDLAEHRRRLRLVPTLKTYIPSPWYVWDHHGQFQTIVQHCLKYWSMLLFSKILYTRELLVLEDGGTIGLDWAHTKVHLPEDTPTIIIQHGLCGDSYSVYIVHFVEKMINEGFRVVIHVARGCGGLELTSLHGFTGSRSDDYHAAVNHIHQRYPQAKLLGVGYSLGAGLTLRYLGTHTNIPLTAAVCVSPPWNFHKHTRVFSRWSFLLAQSLKVYFLKHLHTFSEKKEISVKTVLKSSSITEFDSANMSIIGYENTDEYYTAASPCNVSHHITIPTLAISALDDPVCCITGCPELEELQETKGVRMGWSKKPNSQCYEDVINSGNGIIGPGLIVVKTTHGGHLGFAEGWLPLRDSWVDEVTVEWFAAVMEEDE